MQVDQISSSNHIAKNFSFIKDETFLSTNMVALKSIPPSLKNFDPDLIPAFVDDSVKLAINYPVGIGHTMHNLLLPISDFINHFPESTIIINVSQIANLISLDKIDDLDSFIEIKKTRDFDPTMFIFLVKMLKRKNIKYKIINDPNYVVAKVNNAYLLKEVRAILYPELSAFCSIIDETVDRSKQPFRKIYVSRSRTETRSFAGMELPQDDPTYLGFKDDVRLSNESLLEEFLVNHGFEIVYAEDFSNYEDQIKFMSTVKILVSATSSALNNILFMRPRTTVIELVTPILLINPGDKNGGSIYVHRHYDELSFARKQHHIHLSNVSKKAEDVIDVLVNDTIFSGILQ